MEANKKRTESEIFDELSQLCITPGFIHVITALCFRDNVFIYEEDAFKPEDMASLYSFDRLIRTEISTLIGLMIKSDIDFTLPELSQITDMANRACSLLHEIHCSVFEAITFSESGALEGIKPLYTASMMREPIFYGGESAYIFQYRDLAVERYSKDNDWFSQNKGYGIADVREVILCIENIQNKKLKSTSKSLKELPPEEWSMLPAFVFSKQEVLSNSSIHPEKLDRILDSFSLPEGNLNEDFDSISDFNVANVYPLIKKDEGEYILPLSYTLSESSYDTPFYWFNEDKKYKSTAMDHRGEFTEEFSEKRLKLVFGDKNVFSNVNIIGKDGNIAGEIDVLVIFSNRAIVVQSKSKKLTIESRKGSDKVLKDDFKKAIQNAYDQALSCSKLLGYESCKFQLDDGTEISVPRDCKEIFPICLISEHYPALSFQARQFLKYEVTEVVAAPFVMDIFLLDAMTEMLETPLHFLSYLNRRALYIEPLNMSHELTALSYHLKLNLWFENEYDFIHLGDDISSDLDAAMMVRRIGIEGNRTPDGILTRFVGTKIGNIIEEIETQEEVGTIDLGFMLLTLSEDTLNALNQGIETILNQAKSDKKNHDITVGISAMNTGLTIYSSYDSDKDSAERLQRHCIRRKYTQRAEDWFGICIDPDTEKLRFGLKLNFPWEKNDEMEKSVEGLKRKAIDAALATTKKIGRNEKCPCGSGIKYKKCCLV